MLATAFMHRLPWVFESQAGAQELCALWLAGRVFFCLLNKAERWQHGHANTHHAGGWSVLQGDSVHVFGDGILLA